MKITSDRSEIMVTPEFLAQVHPSIVLVTVEFLVDGLKYRIVEWDNDTKAFRLSLISKDTTP